MCTIQPYTSFQCHFTGSHICTVHVCLAVTCHLHLRQNEQDLLCATAVTQGWNGYRNKSQHRKLTLKKKILPPLLTGLKPSRSCVRHSTTDLSPIATDTEGTATKKGKWLDVVNLLPRAGQVGHEHHHQVPEHHHSPQMLIGVRVQAGIHRKVTLSRQPPGKVK